MPQKRFTVTHETGLHARPATAVVNKAGKYQSDIQLEYNGKSVNLKSVMGLMSLGVSKGAVVTISTEGKDAEEALQGLEELMISESIARVKE